jgi:hypothetical protein
MSEEDRRQICNIAEKRFLGSFADTYEESVKVFHECYKKTAFLVEKVADGEIVDQICLKEGIQKMVYSFRRAQKKREEKDGRNILDPGGIQIPDGVTEISIMMNQAMGNFAQTGSCSDFETGMWLKCISEMESV